MVINKLPARLLAAIVAFTAVYVMTLVSAGCGGKETGGPLKVAASIVPLADFCRNVGGDFVEVETMVPPGASPHTFEPTSGQMRFLSEADVFVYNGLDLETWITDIVRKVGNEGLVQVAAAEAVPESDLAPAGAGCLHDGDGREVVPESDRRSEEGSERGHGEDGGHDHGVYDPHVWLDPNLAVYQVRAIRDGFIRADPGNEGAYRKNAGEYIEELKELDEYVRGETSEFTRKKFVSLHPAFTYYARRYGLVQVGVIQDLPGKEPSAGEMAGLIDAVKEQGVSVIFTEPQFSPRAAETIAAESGAEVVLKSLDPLGDPGNPEVSTYIRLMKHDTRVMAGAMR